MPGTLGDGSDQPRRVSPHGPRFRNRLLGAVSATRTGVSQCAVAVAQTGARIGHHLGMAPWFETREEVFAFIRETAERIVAGEVDPYRGGSELWHTALLVRDRDFRMLMPFAEYTDVLDLPERFTAEELALARASIVEAARALLADQSFWR
jgi:hypothetical protein